ncbi:MAG: hypothetical protein ACFN4A_06350, partial [Streptococcus mutans]
NHLKNQDRLKCFSLCSINTSFLSFSHYTILDLDETDKAKIDDLVANFEASDNIVRVRLIKSKK